MERLREARRVHLSRERGMRTGKKKEKPLEVCVQKGMTDPMGNQGPRELGQACGRFAGFRDGWLNKDHR